MIIGVDVDGVLTELFKYVKKYGPIFAKENNIKIIYNKNATDTIDAFGWDAATDKKFWYEFIWPYSLECKCKKGASKYLQKLKSEGHKIIIITKRYYAQTPDEIGLKMRSNMEEWFKKHKIPYDEICYVHSKKSKLDYAKQTQIYVLIDDSIENLEEISKHIPVICMDSPLNRTYKNKEIERAHNWKEVYQIIHKLNAAK